jgi:hypothetical protein
MSDTRHPVIVDLRTALGEAIDRQQVEIVRAYLDATCPHRYGHIGAHGATCGECGATVDLGGAL